MESEQNNKNLGRIGVLMGGCSSEREISLKSGRAICDALYQAGCQVEALDILDQEKATIFSIVLDAQIDVAFIALHGRWGEDGEIQSILEEMNIPYTGSGTEASRLALNKTLAQDLFKKNDITVPKYVSLMKSDSDPLQVIMQRIGSWPLVIKPACEGSSIGITIVDQKKDLEAALELAWGYDDCVLVEEFIKGKELTVSILDKQALPVVEICPKRDFFDFTAKYQLGMTDYLVPAEISESTALKLQEEALKAHNILGCSDFSRVDFILSEEGQHYLLELNTIPGFTATSLLPKAAQEIGLNFHQLCLKITELAYGKKKEIKGSTIGPKI